MTVTVDTLPGMLDIRVSPSAAAPFIDENGRTYAPIRYLANYFGYTVDWDAATRTVIIR